MKAGFKVGQKLTLFQVEELRALADNGYDLRVSLTSGGFRLDYLHRVLPGGKADGKLGGRPKTKKAKTGKPKGAHYKWKVQLPTDNPNVKDAVFVCRNTTSGHETIREAIDSAMKGGAK